MAYVNCQHWKPGKVAHAGRCSLLCRDVAERDCLSCAERVDLRGVRVGTSGSAQAEALSPRAVAAAEARAAVCSACEYNRDRSAPIRREAEVGGRRSVRYVVSCGACGCGFLPLHILGVDCVKGKWDE